MRVPNSYEDLDTVVVVALEQLQHSLYEMDRHGISLLWGSQPDLLNLYVRNRTIWTFQHLRHLGRTIEPHLVERWALSNGWRNGPSLLLRDYATAVNAGARFHAGPEPYGQGVFWLDLVAKEGLESTED